MNDSIISQDSSMIRVRITERLNKSFRVALAVNNETMQDALNRAITEYVQATVLRTDLLLGVRAPIDATPKQ